MLDTPLSRASGETERVLHDARAVADACAPLPAADGPGTVRAVLRTRPDANSGSLSIEGIALNVDTGRLVDSSGAAAGMEGRRGFIRYAGRYDVLAVLSGSAGSLPGQYAWTEQLRVFGHGIAPSQVYDPFARPGVVLCRHDPAAEGSPFAEVRLLPEGWSAYAAAAVRASAEPDELTARDWLTAPNDLLFARAARSLALAGRMDPVLLGLLREQVYGYRRAVVHYVTLAAGQRPAGPDALDADLADFDEPDRRRAAAIGLLAARLFEPQATGAAVAGWPPAAAPGGLLDASLIAGDAYIREAFSLMSPR